jgi:hypothetical protein
MKVLEIIQEGKPSKSYCRNTPKSKMGASAAASCKSRGLMSRDGKKSHKIGKKRVKVGGRRIKGKSYGGPLPDYS